MLLFFRFCFFLIIINFRKVAIKECYFFTSINISCFKVAKSNKITKNGSPFFIKYGKKHIN